MSGMVERVAKALEESFKQAIEASSGKSFADSKVSSPSRDIWLRYARAAVEAMREPSAFVQQTLSERFEDGIAGWAMLVGDGVPNFIDAFIDAALKEEQP